MKRVIGLFVCIFTCLVSELSLAKQWLYLGDGFQSTSGYIGTTVSHQGNVNDNDEDSNSATFASAIGAIAKRNNWQGFIYRPWVTNVTLSTELQADYNQFDIQKGGHQSYLGGLLVASVQLYPESENSTNFAFNQYIKKKMGQGEDNLFMSTNFQVLNNFQPEGETYSVQTQYGFSFADESEDNRVIMENNLDFTFMDSLELGSYRFVARLNNKNQNYLDSESKNNDVSLQYQQSWFLNEGDSVNLFADITRENDSEKDGLNIRERDYQRAQITATSFIRSSTNDRLTYSFNGFANKTENAINGFNGVEQSSINLSAGSFYDYSDHITFSASLDGIMTSREKGTTDKLFSAFGSVNYQDELELSQTALFNWFVTDSVVLNRGSKKDNINLIRFGDGLTKSFILTDSNISISLDQSIFHEISSYSNSDNLPSEWQLNHDLAINWSSSGGAVNSNVYVLLADSRHLTEDLRQFQQLYVSVQRNQMLSNADSWGGNFVYEWNNTIDEFAAKNSTANAFGTIWYRNVELWNVEALRFTSTLILPLNDLLPDDELRRDDLASWENELDYRIGFLEIRLYSVISEENYYISFEIKRNFDF